VRIDDGDASVGPKDAKVTVVQFADFQCGYCKKLEQAMAAMRKKYAAEVRFVFKHFPMNPRCNRAVQNEKHKYACEAALGAECARRQGKFWPMHDALYANQNHLEREYIDRYASGAGLDPSAYGACMADPATLDAVLRDTDDAAQVKVAGTPRTFVNGRLFSGVLSEDLLDFLIRIELGQVTGKAAEVWVPPAAPAN
jgi:protein-disulfide isomerase